MTRAKSADQQPPPITAVADTDFMYVPLPPEPELPTRGLRIHHRLNKIMPRTLTRRLVAGVVTLVFLIVTIVGSATYYSLKPFLLDRLDQQVSGLANNDTLVAQLVQSGGTSGVFGSPVDVWVGVFSQDGTRSYPITGTSQLHNLSLKLKYSTALATHPGVRTVVTTDGAHLVAQASPGVSLRAVPGSIIVLGLSTQSVHDTLHRLIVLELLLGAAAVLAAALLTSWGVRSELRPLKRVTRTAQEVTAELGPEGTGLERRVPVPEDNTEVGQVASSMNRLLETVQTEFRARVASEERMRQFLADASHELRTPLTSIRGYAELSRLTGRSNDPDDPMIRIETEGTRMSRLVEDLLVLARGDQDSLTAHEPVQVDRVLSEAADVAASAHPQRQINVRASTDAVVIGDHDQLVRLLVNLLNNAAVHTAPSGPIFVEGVRGYTDTGPAVALRVIDSGPGLALEEAAHVFERFWRADKARSRVKGGSGLGMAIVAQIVETHGGQVRFDSAVETGTTVTVTLPVAPAAQPPSNPVQYSPSTRQN